MDPVLEMHSLEEQHRDIDREDQDLVLQDMLRRTGCAGSVTKRKLGTLIVTLAFIAIILSVESVMLYQTLHTNNNFQGFCRACCRSYRPLWYSGRKLPCHAALEKAAGKALATPRFRILWLNLWREFGTLIVTVSAVVPVAIVQWPLTRQTLDGLLQILRNMSPVEWALFGLVTCKILAKRVRGSYSLRPPQAAAARVTTPFVFLSLLIICLGIAQAVLAVVRYRDAYFRVKMVDVAASISYDYAKKLRRVAERSDKEPVNDATCNVEAFRTVRILGISGAALLGTSVLTTVLAIFVARQRGPIPPKPPDHFWMTART